MEVNLSRFNSNTIPPAENALNAWETITDFQKKSFKGIQEPR